MKNNRTYYVRFYNHPENRYDRFVWIVADRETLDADIESYLDDRRGSRLEVARFLCNTPDEPTGFDL
jgi:hypothetical protein